MNSIDSNRVLPIKGGYNFRDLGGLPTKNGKTVKKGLIVRSDELNNLQDSDLELLANLNIKTIVDFRTDQERAQSIDKIPKTCKNQIHLDILSANMDMLMAEFKTGKADFNEIMFSIYKDLVLSEKANQEYTAFFKVLQDPNNSSVIYHCTAGKDRTGIATALILESLGVDWSYIETDYLLSNDFLKQKYQVYIDKNPAMGDLFLVKSEYLQYAFDSILKQYDSVDDYLKNVLNVDIVHMKKLYCE